ncbi:MAG: HYR domain-containing protein, partial [Bacteroidia bacterium]|nr:HYR domain-containing protein [Bacteroidia bacterium]
MIPSFTYRFREIQWRSLQASVISKKQILSLFALLCFINLSIAQTTQTFSSSGTWQAPAGVTTLKVECWGGGGKGGATSFSSNETGGGGGGAYARLNAFGLAPGTTYTVTVGSGSTSTAAGGDSWFNTNSTVLAKGGSTVANNGTGGANGGSATSSIGDVKFAGGNGANGSNNNYGGGGGSSAGTGAAGANGATSNGGNAPTGGGDGGDGRTGSNGNGFAGSIPGGGGGGVRSGTFGSQTGGAGANGRVILTWTCPTYDITSTTLPSSVCIGSAASVDLTSSAVGLPAGSYTVTYNLSGANTGTGLTTSMTVSSAGTGSFSTGVLANSGSTTITITQLSSGAGAAICTSSISANNTATISVGIVNAGSIAGTQSTCFGGDPSSISNAVSGSGAGTITYTWESSTTSATAGFSPISGATADSYDPPAGLTATTWYRRITTSTDGLAVCQATSNAIQVTVSTTQLPTVSAASSSSLTCAGGPFNLFANTNAGYSASVSPALAIPDNLSSGITSTITASGLPTSLTGWKVIVTVNIAHTWTSDIELFLARPGGGFGTGNATNHVGTIAGQSIRLSNDNGGSGDGYANCTFRDDAATNVTTQSGNVTISGNYIPEELLSTLSGNPNGNWTLRVSDDAADDTGTLTSWTLQIVYPNGLSYSWSSAPSGFTSALQNPTGVSANENTTYTVVQTDLTTGCTQSSSVVVNTIANPAPKVIPGDSVLCSGTDLYVHVIDTGAYSGGYPVGSLLEWVNIVANQNVLDSLNVNGNGSIYQAIITTPDGCTGISPVRTIISKSILPNETITHATCNLPNGKIVTNMVMGTAPFHYVWSSGSTILKDTVSSSQLDSIINLATGSYTLEVSDNFGNVNPLEPSCSSIVFTYTVNEVTPPSVNVAGTDISCFGQNDGQAVATPALGTTPYTYIWSNSETTQTIINLGPGTYTVTVTDATGCSSEGQVTIVEPSEITISLNYTEPLCTGSLTGVVYSNVSGGTLPYNYEWFDSGFLPEGLNDDTLINVGADSYYLVITDANGCIGSNSIIVEDPPLLTATCSATPATCFGGGDGSVSILSSGGRGFHTYLWSTGDVTTSVTGLEAGTYTATVTDGNGCTAICTAVVGQPDLVSGTVTGSDVNCINDQASVVVTATGGTAPYTGEGTFTVGVGTHTFPLTDSNGCTGSASITINHLDVDAPVISDCPSDITQCGDIATWVSPTAIDNCTLVSFTSDYNPGASFPVGTTLVTYTATDNAGLVSTCSFNVTILPTPIWYADADGDGFGNPAISLVDCIQPVGYISDNTDCDDSQILYADNDGDLFGAGSPAACGVPVNGDCDDNNVAVNPSATEVCNSIDDDCDGSIDEGVLLTFYADTDADTYGDAAVSVQACSAPVGYVADNTDCDDNNAAVNPAAAEVCNAIDDDCNGLTDDGLVFLNYYVDGDNDGFGAGAATSSCAPIAGSVLVDGDCDDNNAAVNPAATEVCNSIDDDCDGLTEEGLTFLNYYVDGDNDGFGAGAATSSCAPIAGSVLVDGDCDDNNAAVNPAATEVCNGIDDDCDGLTEEGLTFLNYYVDGDNDGFGAGAATSSCAPIAGSVLVDGDCDDNNATVNPAATEVCNGIDDDCDGLTEEGLTFLNYYVDGDNDGFGAGAATSSCAPIAGSVLVDGDCDDNNAAVNPAAAEVCNNIDDDCSGLTDDGLVFLNYYVDGDNDGFGAGAATSSCAPIAGSVLVDGDCDDNNAAVNPAATEVCNGIDDDCDGLTEEGLTFLNYYVDADNDGFGAGAATSSCAPIAGSVLVDGDCDDNNAAVNPAATEVCNSIDDDCDGSTDEGVLLTFYADTDADTYGNAAVSTQACSAPVGYVADNTDCDDNNAAANPAATEICNSIDDDCDGSTDEGVLLTFYADADADTYGNAAVTTLACSAPVGFVADNTDCDDSNLAINPAATEVCGNSIDDNCDTNIDEGCILYTYFADTDNDTYGDPLNSVSNYVSTPPVGYVADNTDCDDNNAAVNPAAVEVCNSIDDNCNGLTDDGLVFLNYYVDGDNDGFGAGAATSSCAPIAGSVLVDGDCDDNNSAVNPAAVEICNAIDDDCNGLTDDGLVFLNYYVDADNDGFGAGAATSSCAPIAGSVLVDGDCDDNNIAVNPAATEVCNSIDDDCDGSTDEGVLLTFYADADADSYGNAAVSTQACSAPVGYVADNTDCDDNNAAVNPAAVEICNSIDDDCNGLTDDGLVFLNYYVDGDNDGFGAGAATSSCAPIAGSVLVDGDCDDNNSAVNPAATEICNAIDDDCNGLTDDGLVFLNYYVDADNDGFGAGAATSSCAPIAGSVLVDGDCDDNNIAVNPAATEVCNSIDDDCDGSTDEGVLLTFYADADADSYGNAAVSTQACSAPVGYVADNTDCDDNNAAVNPAAVEICNAIDDDCNGLTDDGLVFLNYYVDGDNDGFGAGAATSSCAPIAGSVLVDGDCDDNNAAANPAATEICNAIDDDCNGLTDDG